MNSTGASIAPRNQGWIISRNQDIIWLQGSVLAGLALLFLFFSIPGLNSANYSVAHPAVLTLLLWGVLLDGTHVFGTYARTYFAPDKQSRLGLPSNLSWAVIAVGPAIALVDYIFCTPGPSLIGQAGWIFRYFLMAAYLWAFWHLIRQHYGIMILYRRKAGDYQGNLDTAFLWTGCLYPYLRFGLSDYYAKSGLPLAVPLEWFSQARMVLDIGFVVALAALAFMWLRRQGEHPIKLGPKHAFLLIVVSFNILVFSLLENLLTITAALTIFHNLQYHRIVFLYEKGKNRIPMGTIYRYLGLGALFGVLWYGPRVLGPAVSSTNLIRNIILGVGWGIAFHHYVIDARIWKVRKQPAVAQTLDAGAV